MRQLMMMVALHQRRSAKNAFARLKDAQNKSSKEECVLVMGQPRQGSDAALMDARILLSKEVYARDMGQRSNYATSKDALIKHGMEKYALDMGQKANLHAAAKDAQIKLSLEDCASGMGQRSNHAAAKDAKIKFKKEECAKGMGQILYSNIARRCKSQGNARADSREGATKIRCLKV